MLSIVLREICIWYVIVLDSIKAHFEMVEIQKTLGFGSVKYLELFNRGNDEKSCGFCSFGLGCSSCMSNWIWRRLFILLITVFFFQHFIRLLMTSELKTLILRNGEYLVICGLVPRMYKLKNKKKTENFRFYSEMNNLQGNHNWKKGKQAIMKIIFVKISPLLLYPFKSVQFN